MPHHQLTVVSSCSDCPFEGGDGRGWCKIDSQYRGTPEGPGAGGTPENQAATPTWCPLKLSPVTIALDGGPCGEQGPRGQCLCERGHTGRHESSTVSWSAPVTRWTGVRFK